MTRSSASNSKDFSKIPFGWVDFTLSHTDQYGDVWTTKKMQVYYDLISLGLTEDYTTGGMTTVPVPMKQDKPLIDQLKDNLESLPHKSIEGVNVHLVWAHPLKVGAKKQTTILIRRT